MSYLNDLTVKCGFKVLPEDEIVTQPQVSVKYHLSWASNRGMVWVLKRIEGNIAILETPKTKRKLSAKINDLRHINKNIIAIAKKRIKTKQNYVG